VLGTNFTGQRIVISVVWLLTNHDLFIDACTTALMDVLSHRKAVFEGWTGKYLKRMLLNWTLSSYTWKDANWWYCSNIHVQGC